MLIKRLRLAGFKSFVDPAELWIEPGLTGVVGPNGCGKSNLLEALRWTMGETSARSLRGGGMEDVIFAGTARRPARSFAEVSLLAELAGQETEVVRRIERGAGSAYRIDGRDVRARDVALLFADAATGAHSPALVSQGRIGALLTAKPEERRQMLEEAAGIAGLHVRRREAELKLTATEANLERLDQLAAEQDARLTSLRRQARQAERYRALTERIQLAEARLIFARWREAAQAADIAQRAVLAGETAVVEIQAALAAATDARDMVAKERGDAAAALATARDAMAAIAAELAAARAELRSVEERQADLTRQRDRLAQDRAREATLAADAAQALARLEAETATLATSVAAAAERLPVLDGALADAQRQASAAEAALTQAVRVQAEQQAGARAAQAMLATARSRHDRLKREVTALAQDALALAETAPLQAARERAARAQAEAVAEAGAARQALAAAELDLRAAEAARERATTDRAAAHAALAALDSERAALALPVAPATAGRLLDAVTVAAGHEQALAAALGDDLDAGLDPAAERHWAGAATQPGDPGPGDLARLSDFATAPAALARRLAMILVAERDDGRPLGPGQRLVTLDGRLRRWDGFVATRVGAAAAERLQRVNRLAELDRRRPALAAALDRATAALAQADRAIAAVRAAATAGRAGLDRAERAQRDAARDEDRAGQAIERHDGRRADLETRRARLAGEVGDAEAALGEAMAAMRALPDGAALARDMTRLQAEAGRQRAALTRAQADRADADRRLAADRARAATAAADRAAWIARADTARERGTTLADDDAALAEQLAVLAARPAALADAAGDAERSHVARQADVARAAAIGQEADRRLAAADAALAAAAEAAAIAREGRATAVARAEAQDGRRAEMARVAGERFACPPPLLPERIGFAEHEVGDPQRESRDHDMLIADRERLGPVNLVAADELATLDQTRAALAADREELGQAVAELRGSIGLLNREGRQRLRAAFTAVNGHFGRLFTTLFEGGQAHLALIDAEDPLAAGLEIMAQPPGKKLQSLSLLSGGEQALTAIALIFALFLTNPAPLCVLDEVDAPLDDANIDRFCTLLELMTRETATRFLVVTHNAVTMSRMHRLFGVTMVEQGVSRLVSVDLGGAERLLAAE